MKFSFTSNGVNYEGETYPFIRIDGKTVNAFTKPFEDLCIVEDSDTVEYSITSVEGEVTYCIGMKGEEDINSALRQILENWQKRDL